MSYHRNNRQAVISASRSISLQRVHRRCVGAMCCLCILLCIFPLFTSCDYATPVPEDCWESPGPQEPDSVEFLIKHHYWKNDFFVLTDTLVLQDYPRMGLAHLRTEGGLPARLEKGDIAGVADIHLAHGAEGKVTVWVKLARDRFCTGWVEEKDLLRHTIPDRPISKFIYYFSNRSFLYFGSLVLMAALILMIRLARRKKIRFVHFNDVRSFYPTLLCLMVSAEATVYGTIQRFAPDTWVQYYFHPTLHPFADGLPLILSLFLLMFWLIILVGVATLEDLRHIAEDFGITAYCAGLTMTCIALYLLFSLSVHIYIGYPLLLGYWFFAFRRHHRLATPHYRCGHCGAPLDEAGIGDRCPQCGAENALP